MSLAKKLAQRVLDSAETYSDSQRGESRKQIKGHWRASSMGLCARLQAYDFLGFHGEKPVSNEKRLSLEDGHVHEADVIGRILSLKGIEEIAQNENTRKAFRTKDEVLKIAGTPDLEIMDHGKYVVVEVKAVKESTFQEIQRSNVCPEKYVTQCKVYLVLKGKKHGIVYIKDRNNSDFLTFDVLLTKADKKRILKRQLWVQSFVRKKKLPPREYQIGSQECFYCPHNRRCRPTNKFKGYIHKKGKGQQKNVTVDLSDEGSKGKFIIAAKTFEMCKRKMDSLDELMKESKDRLERLLRKYKADGVEADGYSAKRIAPEAKEVPDPAFIKRLLKRKDVPMVMSNPTSYIRVDLPKKKGNRDD